MPANKNQVAKQIALRKAHPKKVNNPAPRSRLVVAPTTRAVRASGPSNSQRQQELVIPVKVTNGDVGGQTRQVAQEFILHPAYIPWLAQIAPSYQRWGLAGLKVWYEPRVSTSTNGTVAIAFVSDFKDATPTSLDQITRIKGSQRGAPWDKFNIPCQRSGTFEYTSQAAFDALSSDDKNTRALGRIVVFADMDAGFTDLAGRIYIEYSPVLLDPTDPTLQG